MNMLSCESEIEAMENNDKKTKKSSKKPTENEIIERLRSENLLIHDEKGVGYIAINKQGTVVIPTDSLECKKWLRNWLVKEYHRYDFKKHDIDEICGYLSAIAEVDGEERLLGVRLSKTIDDSGNPKEVYYDTKTDLAVKVSADGWETIPTPIRFKRFSQQLRQDLPMKTESRNLELLREFVNIQDDSDFLVFMVFAVSLFVPDSPSVLLCMNGDMGAGKSASLRLLVKLVDPSSLIEGMRMTWKTEDLIRVSSKNAVLFFDNVSSITDYQSDDLCKICTGSSLSKRKLYTDEDELIYRVQRPVLISGIPRLIHRADLSDRSIILTVKRLNEKQRKTQGELDARLQELKPRILGAIFNVLSDAIRKYKTIEPKEKPRVMDWYKLACAIADSLDGHNQSEFETAFKKVQERQLDYALQESPVALAAKFLVDKCRGKWSGSATELLGLVLPEGVLQYSQEELDYISYLQENPYWPKNASVLGKELARCRSTLEACGIEVVHGDGGKSVYKGGQRYIQLTDLNRKPEEEEFDLSDIPF